MNIHSDTFLGRGKPPLTRSEVEERLRQVGSSAELKLVGENLSKSDLSNLSLRRADLSGADLSGADLSGADLSFANLSGANLSGATLIGATLSGADLSFANLSVANLSFASLSGANLSGANLLNADLKEAKLIRAHFSKTQVTLDPEFLLQCLGIGIPRQTSKKQEKERGRREAVPALRLRIQEEPLTAHHLSATLDALTSLYVKAWLLQQGRFDDFVRYTEQKDRRFEEEANLLIAELKYNSPADIKFNIDLSPKAFIEALQMLIDTIMHAELRKQAKEEEIRSQALDNRLKEETIRKECLNNVDHKLETTKRTAELIETLCPGLDAEKKLVVLPSLMKDILHLAEDPTLEISLLLSATLSQQQPKQSALQEQEGSAQTSEKLLISGSETQV